MRARLPLAFGVLAGAIGLVLAGPADAGEPTPPSLQVTKTGPTITAAGSVIFYDVAVTNPGTDPLLDAMLFDQLGVGTDDAFIDIVSDAPWTCDSDLATLQVTCTASSLPPGLTHIIVGILVRDDVAVGDVVTNTVQVSATDVEPVGAQSSATVIGESTIAVDADGPAYTQAPGTVTYHAVLRNTGQVPALLPNLIVDLPDPLFPVTPQVAPPGWDCNFTPALVYSCIGPYQLDAGASASFDLSFTVAAGTAPGTLLPLVFRGAAINATRVETPVTTTVVGATELMIAKRAPAAVGTGARLRYELEVSNPGPWPALRPVVTDPLPAGFAVGRVVVPGGWECALTSATLSCTAEHLLSGAGTVVVVIGRVDAGAGTVLHNRATASATNAAEVVAEAETRVTDPARPGAPGAPRPPGSRVPPEAPVPPGASGPPVPPGPVTSPGPGDPPGAGARGIAFTGAAARSLAAAGGGLLVLGAVLFGGAARRRAGDGPTHGP